MRLPAIVLAGLALLGCSSSSNGETGVCADGCACFTTPATCPQGCFATYAEQPDGGAAFACSNTRATVYDPYYFYCHVEPEFLVAYGCGAGDPSKGDAPGGCHYDAPAVSGMVLVQHPAVDCGGGEVPLDLSQVAAGSPADVSFQAASLEMAQDYTIAPIFIRPSSSAAHPRIIFDASDPTVSQLLETWASK